MIQRKISETASKMRAEVDEREMCEEQCRGLAYWREGCLLTNNGKSRGQFNSI